MGLLIDFLTSSLECSSPPSAKLASAARLCFQLEIRSHFVPTAKITPALASKLRFSS
eukprot:m.533854 g.533854  ORF g.533854 m.533854 type:complete len:57 (-) comp57598_c1_seq70:4040-4210(-)